MHRVAIFVPNSARVPLDDVDIAAAYTTPHSFSCQCRQSRGIGQNSGQDAGQKKIAAPAFWSSV